MRYSKSFRRGFSFSQLLFLLCGVGLILGFIAGLKFFPQQWLASLISRENATKILALYVPGSGGDVTDLLPENEGLEGYKLILAQNSGAFSGDVPVTAEPEFPEQFQTDNDGSSEKPISPQSPNEIPQKKDDFDAELDKSQPLVAFYCTHSAETYNGSEGVDKVEGKNGGVFQVAKVMQESLDGLGIPSVLCETIHDYPNWSKSYANSLDSINQLKEKYPSLRVFVDVHRDVKPEGGTTVLKTADGNVAKVMLVVGCDKRLEHPLWKENLSFAQKVGNSLEEYCPGIMRGVRVQNGRYNQHVSTYAILLEMGSTENTLEEVKASGYLVAEVLADIIYADKDLVAGNTLIEEKRNLVVGGE